MESFPKGDPGHMSARDFLAEHREQILEKWLVAILRTYPEDSLTFLVGEKDRFRNPVGHIFREGIGVLFDSLIDAVPRERVTECLESIVKMRAVQEFPPAAAVSFVFLLKKVLWEEFHESHSGESRPHERMEIDSKIDGLALEAFDKYMDTKTRIFDLRLRELKNRSVRFPGNFDRIEEKLPPPEEGAGGDDDIPPREGGDTACGS